MKFLTYILRNARRNPVRTGLTIASTSICLFLMMILLSFFAMNTEATSSSRIFNRIVTMNANGFAGTLPVSRSARSPRMDGVVAATPFQWYGGKYHDEVMPFAQFGSTPILRSTSWTSSLPARSTGGFQGQPVKGRHRS